jgi:hypothetical protein
VICSQKTFMRRLPAIVSRASMFANPSKEHREMEAVRHQNRLGAPVRAARQELESSPTNSGARQHVADYEQDIAHL